MLQSCSSGDETSSSGQGVLIKRITGADGSYCNYSYNGNKLLKMTWNDGTSRVITYTGNLITRSEIRDANNTFNGEFDTMSYSNGQLVQYKNYYNNILLYKDDITYNSDGTRTITETSYSEVDGSFQGVSLSKQYFDTAGNIVRNEYLSSSNTITSYVVYLYDTMNNPTKNITGWINGPWTSRGLVNNIVKSTDISGGFTDVTNYSYQYNNQGYPISQVSSNGSSTSSCQYFY
jgi:YD repeat-containing protein